MKILFQKDYDDLLGQIKRAEQSAAEAQKKISKVNSESLGKDIIIENLEKNIQSKNKTLLLTESELVRIREQRDNADNEVKELKKKYRKQNSQKGGYVTRIKNLSGELEKAKQQLAEKEIIIENFRSELKKYIPKKSVIDYEKGIRR